MSATCSPARPRPRHEEGRESDEQLVQRILAGEREAFDQLYGRYIGRVYRFVETRLRNRADVEETTQEVFAAVFSSLGSFRAEAPFAAWVLGVARRTIYSRFKKREHPTVPLETDDGDQADAHVSAAPSPHEFYELRERVQRLEALAERLLSAEQRELFRLHHLEHRAISEIATSLQKSEDAVKSNLYRVRKVLLSR